jgi:UDP:flavonoid glycosyltransferase YjiC (YdhE family)
MLNKKQQSFLDEHLLTSEKFNDLIEQHRINFDTYLDTISDYVQNNNMEIAVVKKLLNPQILSKLRAECEFVNLISKQSNTNPLF